ncbi:hypothetical protein ES705_37289 [subsurface metagenome]
MKRIVQVVHDFLPTYPHGTENYTYHLSKELQKISKVYIFCREPRDFFGKDLCSVITKKTRPARGQIKKLKILTNKGEKSMSKPEKTYLQENHVPSDLLIGQVDHMAELIDRLQLQIKQQHLAIVAKDQHINNLNKAIVAKDQHINNLNKAIVAKDQHINNLNKAINKAIAAKDHDINNLNKAINKAIAAKDHDINNLNKAIAAKDQHIANLDGFIRDLTREIVNIKKYSVFYNLLSRFRRELLTWFGKSRK